ncbi:ATP-binding protein [Sporosarcina trichiuri]|uniref:ATP-binding protein n=1 Tax=Sporosarcina trichiuri TaxID=3056445 RepID=UPI003D67B82B
MEDYGLVFTASAAWLRRTENPRSVRLTGHRIIRLPLISLVGGGTYSKPIEISLAHRDVLFLGELVEFSCKTLDILRQPMLRGY